MAGTGTTAAESPKARPESVEAIKARLAELERLEDANAKAQERLENRWKTKDERIRQRRDTVDSAIAMIYAARSRTDDRIRAKRLAQTEAFEQKERAFMLKKM